jgi:uncharacterized protein YqeY
MSIQNAVLLRSNEVRVKAKNDSSFRKESDFFVTLYSEISSVGFNDGKRQTTNEEAVKVINKFIKNANFIINETNNQDAIKIAQQEILWCNEFLPKMMSEEEIKHVVESLVVDSSVKLGDVMKHFKEHFPGLYDGKKLSSIANSLIKKITL